ncbi:DUF2180 family protein [bacterium]|nr:DUF2180 family protein [bacterium]
MKCYNHHDRDAFGICKSCGKGLCLECLKEKNGAIVCKKNACSSRLGRGRIWSILTVVLLSIIVLLTVID